MIKRLFSIFVIYFSLTSYVFAATTIATSSVNATPIIDKITCPDAKIWGSFLIDQICWSCMFPIYISKVKVGSGEIPADSATDLTCTCKDRQGVPHIGTTEGMWTPAKVIELVRKPYCSPVMGGKTIMNGTLLYGSKGDAGDSNVPPTTFYNYHMWAFPLYVILDLLVEPRCNAGGFNTFDMMYLSEFDPTWNEDELAFYINPEAAALANPLMIASCVVDCAATLVTNPIESLFWCAGCWGGLYPFTGNVDASASPPRESSLLAARSLASLHRKGLEFKTYGSANLCGGGIAPMIPKPQYKFSMLFPIAESESLPIPSASAAAATNTVTGVSTNAAPPTRGSSCCHRLGQSTFTWGEWRNIPGIGEDFVYLIWRWTNCCLIGL